MLIPSEKHIKLNPLRTWNFVEWASDRIFFQLTVVCFPDFPFHQILPSMWFQGGDSEIFLWARDMTLEADLKTKKHADSYKKIDGWFEQKSLQAEIFRGSKLWYARTWEGLVESVVFTLFWAMVRLPQCRCAWTRSWSPAEFLNRQLWDVKLS